MLGGAASTSAHPSCRQVAQNVSAAPRQPRRCSQSSVARSPRCFDAKIARFPAPQRTLTGIHRSRPQPSRLRCLHFAAWCRQGWLMEARRSHYRRIPHHADATRRPGRLSSRGCIEGCALIHRSRPLLSPLGAARSRGIEMLLCVWHGRFLRASFSIWGRFALMN